MRAHSRTLLALLGALIASPAFAGEGGHLLQTTRSGKLGLRLDGSVLLYGSETLRLPIAGTAGRLNREITTENWVAQVGLGPQIVLPLRGARPYLHGFA